mmetsp:Transcript_9318/g.14024  ORF Transcript_9318/g.14024 Transcript_9318/m.14024 type:complete len:297 (-) Transcript_9318:26-916(-)
MRFVLLFCLITFIVSSTIPGNQERVVDDDVVDETDVLNESDSGTAIDSEGDFDGTRSDPTIDQIDELGEDLDKSASDSVLGENEAPVVEASRFDIINLALPKKIFSNYNELLKTNYNKVSFAQGTVLGVVGDFIAQSIEKLAKSNDSDVKPKKLLGWIDFRRMFDVGFLCMLIDGLITPRWYTNLEKISEEKTFKIVALKTVLSSLIFGPIANGLFLAGIPILRYGKNAFNGGYDWLNWRKQLLIASIRDVQIWTVFSPGIFLFIPLHWRPLATNVLGVVLITFLSFLSLKSPSTQ